MTRIILLVPALLSFAAHAAAAEFPWTDYKPFTIAKAIADLSAIPPATEYFDGGNLKYVVRVVFTGTKRQLSPDVKSFLTRWGVAFSHNDVVPLFKQEILVREQDKDYWLPIQESLVQPLVNAPPRAQALDLCVLVAGKTKGGQFVLLICEFNTDVKSPPAQP
jgi:hypothetical protein